MPIAVTCPHCGTKLKAPDKAAGKTLNCPKCASSISVPANEPAGRQAPPPAVQSDQPEIAPPPNETPNREVGAKQSRNLLFVVGALAACLGLIGLAGFWLLPQVFYSPGKVRVNATWRTDENEIIPDKNTVVTLIPITLKEQKDKLRGANKMS